MTVNQALNTALVLLGYTDNDGNAVLSRRIMNKAVAVANMVCEDLHGISNTEKEFVPINGLSDEVMLEGKAREAVAYGIAAFIAQTENDADNQRIWMAVYNQKRGALSKSCTVKDVLPHI